MGCVVPGHVNESCLEELCRITKKGNYLLTKYLHVDSEVGDFVASTHMGVCMSHLCLYYIFHNLGGIIMIMTREKYLEKPFINRIQHFCENGQLNLLKRELIKDYYEADVGIVIICQVR